MKRKFLSGLLAFSMLFTPIMPIYAEDSETDTSDIIQCTLSPENYAVVHLSNTGYSDHLSKAKLLNLYYNTPYTSGSIYTEFGSVISSYRVPLKTAIETMSVSYQIGSGSGIKTDRYIPVFYDTNKFNIDAEPGSYTGPRDDAESSAEYAAAAEYADNYWCATGTNTHDFAGKNFENQVAYKINTTTTGYVAHDVSQTALTAYLADADEEYITFATGREVSGYTNAYLNVKSEEEIPTLTLTYSKSVLLDAINTASQDTVFDVINDLGYVGALKETTNGYDAYSSLIADAKSYVNSTLYETIANGGFDSLDTFYTAYDESVSFAQSNGTLIAINNVTSADGMKAMLEELGEAGSLDTTACGYAGYKELISALKTDVTDGLYAVVEKDGFTETDEFYALYETLVSEANTEFLNIINSTDTDTEALINEMGELGLFDKYAENPYSTYNTLNDDMKLNVASRLNAGGFETVETFYSTYDNAVMHELNIEVELMPENRATIHITRDGYADHTKYAKKLGVYYNKTYSGLTYSEFGSLISGYRVPLKDTLTEMKFQCYVNKGGMQSGRTIPIFYDFNMFSVNAEPGYYLGPVSATDTTEATEATQEYKDVLEYTKNYWPESGYSAKGTAFENQLAHSILETATGTKIYDMTENLLGKFLDSDSDSITFATGRDTSEYSSGAFDTSTYARIPKLVLAYDTFEVLEKINTSTADEMTELIDGMGKANMLERGDFGYTAYTALNDEAKSRIAEILCKTAAENGYTTFDAFIADFDIAASKSETKISNITVSDSKNKYTTAADAAGKEVTISAPVSFAETIGTFTAILAEYADDSLISVKTDDVSYTDTELKFTHTLSDNVSEVKMMIFDSLNGMRPLCEAVSDRDGTLDGKKVIIIGDSYVYYGRTVEAETEITQSARSDDRGGFYQLCKANGMDVSVTNWTFGSHGLSETFDGVCTETTCSGYGKSHEDYLTDRDFDYVIVSPTRGADLSVDFTYIMDFFKEANPNVKFVCLGSMGIHGINKVDTVYPDMIEYYDTLREQGVIIADWGEMVSDIIAGDVTVPDATQEYVRSSFVVKDNYHPNLLTGYLTTLFAYCAITGEAATEQTYSYISDGSAEAVFDIQSYLERYYTNGDDDTNFPEILASQSDMEGLQQLVDEYLSAEKSKKLLDGKKVIFIGNSHTYRGMTVIEKELSVLDQESRSNDTGYFYQMCKANGIDVSVTNWTFSGHALFHTFGGNPCTHTGSCYGENHEDYLTDRYFDYVFINSGTGVNSEAQFFDNVTYIRDFFKKVNPDVKIVILGTASSYGCNQNNIAYPGVTGSYKEFEDMGVIIADWGRVVTGIIDGDYTVSDANYDYTKSSFIVSDQYHANALTGYITTLTAYCAVTGESAVGQPYEFCTDSAINSKFDMNSYANKYYTNGASDTNFDEIFQSESDIRGIQSVVDAVIESKSYRENSDTSEGL